MAPRGGTHSALCLSSARIWSLGFRLYLQGKKGQNRHYDPTLFDLECPLVNGAGEALQTAAQSSSAGWFLVNNVGS